MSGWPIRCNKTVNDGRHACRFLAGHEGACHPHVNARPAPVDPHDDPLFLRVEAAIKLASELGPESVYDFVHGRGMKIERERIRDDIAALRFLASPPTADKPTGAQSRAEDRTP